MCRKSYSVPLLLPNDRDKTASYRTALGVQEGTEAVGVHSPNQECRMRLKCIANYRPVSGALPPKRLRERRAWAGRKV